MPPTHHPYTTLQSPSDILTRPARPQHHSTFVPRGRDWRYTTGVYRFEDFDDAREDMTIWDELEEDTEMGIYGKAGSDARRRRKAGGNMNVRGVEGEGGSGNGNGSGSGSGKGSGDTTPTPTSRGLTTPENSPTKPRPSPHKMKTSSKSPAAISKATSVQTYARRSTQTIQNQIQTPAPADEFRDKELDDDGNWTATSFTIFLDLPNKKNQLRQLSARLLTPCSLVDGEINTARNKSLLPVSLASTTTSLARTRTSTSCAALLSTSTNINDDGAEEKTKTARSKLEINKANETVTPHITLPLRHILTFPFLAMQSLAGEALKLGIRNAERKRRHRIEEEGKKEGKVDGKVGIEAIGRYVRKRKRVGEDEGSGKLKKRGVGGEVGDRARERDGVDG